MSKKEQPKTAEAEGEAAPPKGKSKLIIIIILAVLLSVGVTAGGVFFFLKKGNSASHQEAVAHAEPAVPVKKQAVYEELAPAFVVNYNYKGKQHYLQVSVSLMGRDKDEMTALNEIMPILRNELVMLFSSQDFESLMTPEGKEALRQKTTDHIKELAKKNLGKEVVEKVLFTNLALQ
jgi:flagellar FliL protein